MSKALKTLASAVNVRRGQPCDYSTTFRNEVREYVIDNHQRLKRLRAQGRGPTRGERMQSQALAKSDNEDDTPARPGYKKFMSTVNEFFDVWNGRWWVHGVCEHVCSGPHCCPNGHATTVQRMRASGQALLFDAGVTRLAANKWNKLGPLLDWVIISCLPHGMLGSCLQSLGLKVDQQRHASLAEDADHHLEEEVDFARLRGKRYQMSVSTFNSASHVRTLLMLAIALEAHRYLSDYWLLRARSGY